MTGIKIGVLLLSLTTILLASGNPAFNGEWTLVPQKSSEIDLYGTLGLSFDTDNDRVELIQKWGSGRSFADTLKLLTDGSINRIPIRNRVWPTNVFMGISLTPGTERKVKAYWSADANTLTLESDYTLRGSQGPRTVSAVHRFQLTPETEILRYRIDRTTRPESTPIEYLLKRKGSREAFVMHLPDEWQVEGKLDENAFLISLQGTANSQGPILYFIYPPNWAFNYTPAIYDFYHNDRYYTFTELKTKEQALERLKDRVKGYVVWDPQVRTSLIVAFTAAGLEQAVVVSPRLIPLVEKAGLEMKEDLRDIFLAKSDYEIYSWAYDRYWARCNKELIIWMGGEYGDVMKPGVADWGIYKKTFFNDLSSVESDTLEYALAKKLLGEMTPMSLVMGWHSYAKDKERDHVKLTSSFGHTVEGLHTLPNMSFNSQVPATPGFEFRNNHHLRPDSTYKVEKKVYITCVQTDGLGIGAWTKPGRGEIPYAWEVIMNYHWLAPAVIEFWYSQATPNDYFIGCLSGPGYMYPKAVPPQFMPTLLERAYGLMKKLDLNVFEIMDYSEGATVEGNTELPREIVDFYYDAMPEAIGFVNGYAPSYTFAHRDGRPFISYDYYLSPTRPEADAVADLKELAAINSDRPYFLLMHVRESSDVKRVKSILDQLGPEFELIPLDVFLHLAGQKPTFQERFLLKP
ncbi:hypothetical protein JW992_08845 [candidate division KSB1 bacterium]|nr:hypothetical protein [candidate division KSB1 bacterium]